MNLAEVYYLANKRLNEHGLLNWKFEWDNAKTRFGSCQYHKKTITLSKILTPHRTYEQINNTILHEIAHALVGADHGHNNVWRQKAIEIGCDGNRCGEVITIKSKYKLVCECCGKETPMFRKPNRSYSCGYCGVSKKYDPKFKMKLVVEN